MQQMVFMMLDAGIKMIRQGEDFYIYCGDVKRIHFYNCKDVSEAFLKDMFDTYREFIGEQGYDEINYEEIDVREMLEWAIRDGAWDWRKEVREYAGHEG